MTSRVLLLDVQKVVTRYPPNVHIKGLQRNASQKNVHLCCQRASPQMSQMKEMEQIFSVLVFKATINRDR